MYVCNIFLLHFDLVFLSLPVVIKNIYKKSVDVKDSLSLPIFLSHSHTHTHPSATILNIQNFLSLTMRSFHQHNRLMTPRLTQPDGGNLYCVNWILRCLLKTFISRTSPCPSNLALSAGSISR